jgi:hypothetical protein
VERGGVSNHGAAERLGRKGYRAAAGNQCFYLDLLLSTGRRGDKTGKRNSDVDPVRMQKPFCLQRTEGVGKCGTLLSSYDL